MSTKRRLIEGSASGLVERLLNLVVQVWLFQHLIKRISPEEYSLYPVVSALMVFVPPLTTVLTAGLARDTMEAHTSGDDRRVTEIISTIFPVLLSTGLCLLAVGLVAVEYLGSILNIAPANLSEGRLMTLLLLGSLVFRLILVPFGVGLYVRQRFVLANTLVILQAVIKVVLLFVLLLGIGPRVLWVVVATVTADAVIVLATTVLSVQTLPALRFRLHCIRWSLLSNLLAFGFWNMICSLGVFIRKSSDVLVLNRFATPVDVDSFQLASLTDNQIDATLIKLVEPVGPHMVALHTTGAVRAMRQLYIRGGRYSLWAALFVATPLIAFRQQLWSHYLGSRFSIYGDVPIVMVLLLARYWLECPIGLLGTAAYAMQRMRTLSLIVIAYALTNLAITIYFVHYLHMGAIGSASGTLVSVLLWVPLIMWKFGLNLLGLKFGEWFKATVWRGSIPSLIAGLFGWGWNFWMQPQTIPELLLATAIVSAIYVLSIVLFCLDQDERLQIRQVFEKISSSSAYKNVASWTQP